MRLQTTARTHATDRTRNKGTLVTHTHVHVRLQTTARTHATDHTRNKGTLVTHTNKHFIEIHARSQAYGNGL